MHPCQLEDAALLRECRVETYRSRGPGGQKKNKTSSAVRIVHIASSISAVATESRSQHENRAAALERLRLELALSLRRAPSRPEFWGEITNHAGRLAIGYRSALFAPAIAHIFDTFEAHCGSLADAAADLGMSTAGLAATLASDATVFAAAQQLRAAHGKHPLANPRK